MAKIWLTSDTHFSHKNTLRYCGRPFFTIAQCDQVTIDRWNSVVKPEDTVYHLGDVAMHTKPMLRILPQLNGRKILIIGNHDLIYPYFIKTRGQKFVDRVLEDYKKAGFVEIYSSGHEIEILYEAEIYFEAIKYDRISVPKLKARLSHFPTKNAYDIYHGDKHDASRPIDDGRLNICGHVHQNWLKRGNNVNVGVDVWDFKPVLLEDVVSLWRTGPKDIGTPKALRVWVWTKYHTLVWRINKLLDIFRKKELRPIKSK